MRVSLHLFIRRWLFGAFALGLGSGLVVPVGAAGARAETGQRAEAAWIVQSRDGTAEPAASAPKLTSPSSASGTVGTAFVYQVTADDPAATLGMTGSLPTGLSFDVGTGQIAGTPGQAGNFPLVLTASNAAGMGRLFITLTVVPVDPPRVTIVANVPSAAFGTSDVGELTLTLSHAVEEDLVVTYDIRGSAKNGMDYGRLSGQAKVKAGKTSKVIKVRPLGDGNGLAKRTVKLTVKASVLYAVEAGGTAKVKLVQAATALP